MGRFSQQIGASCLLNLYDVQYCIAGLKYKGISVINDQTLAGLILKLGGGIILWVSILVIWMRWYQDEKTFDDVVRNNSND